MNDVWVWFAEQNTMDRILYDSTNPAQVISRRQDASAVVWGMARNAAPSPHA
jgi:hypothetical protein